MFFLSAETHDFFVLAFLLTRHRACLTIVHSMNNNEQKTNLTEYHTLRLRQLINEIHDCCKERVVMEAKKFNLAPSEVKCLMLFERHRYLTALEIADLLEVAKSRATVIVDGLEKKSLIKRGADPSDARVKLITLTPDGQRQVRSIEAFVLSLHERLLEQIDPAQRATVITALETLRSSMEAVKTGL